MKHHHIHWIITSRVQPLDSVSPTDEHEITIGMKPCADPNLVRLEIIKLDLTKSPIRHAALDAGMCSMIKYLVGAFPGIMEWSFEMWEEYIRKQPDPGFEIDHWMAVDRAFVSFAGGKPLECQMEVFRLCMLQSIPLAILDPLGNQPALLTDDEVDSILDDYYGYYLEL